MFLNLGHFSASRFFKKGPYKKCRFSVLFEVLLSIQVQRIIWPELLSRFSVEQVIERALGREGETCYDMLQNNCEHFVTWCMCDLSISIQVKRVYLRLRSALYALLAGGVHLARHEGVQRLLVLFFKASNL